MTLRPNDQTYKWWALSCTSLGMLLATINSGTLIIALPNLERSLHTGLLTLVWAMVAAVGLVIGPVLGGALVAIGWPWVFWFNVPLALAGSAWAAMILRDLTRRDEDTGFDVLGTVTFLIGLTGLVLGISKGGISGWGSPVVLGGLAAAAVVMPAFVLIERHHRAPMLDLSIFSSRLFSAAAAAAFINGLARFALMFVFVFYFQGVQGNSPILAGVKLAPLALGMLISSPLAGVWADRRGSREMAVLGMLVTAAGLALMTTLGRDTSYTASGIYLFIVGIGSGMFNSPNTAAMMGTVPARRRGIAAGARVLVQNTGAVISIAFVLAVVTSSGPKEVLFKVFSGLANHISNAQLDPFLANMQTALWVLSAISVVGAFVAAARPKHSSEAARIDASAPDLARP